MSLIGVQNILKDAEKNVTGEEIGVNIHLETEDHSESMLAVSEDSEEQQEPIADGRGTATQLETQTDNMDLEHIIQELSVEVAMGTDECYRRFVTFPQ